MTTAMDKPNCKICGVRHYVYEPHDFGPSKAKPAAKKKKRKAK